jgi:hypothetical protein
MNVRCTLEPRITDAVSGLGYALALVSPFLFGELGQGNLVSSFLHITTPPHFSQDFLKATNVSPLKSLPSSVY